MKIDPQHYLDLVEQSGDLVFFDLESTGFKGDYNSILCGSLKPYGQKPYSFTVKQVGNDQKIIKEIKAELEKYHVWCGFYSKGFDIPMLNTRLLKWDNTPVESRHHIDMFFTLKFSTNLSSRSMAAAAGFLKTPEQKMPVPAYVWSEIGFDMSHMKTLQKRCESDVSVLEDVYRKSRHLIKDIKNGGI